MSWQHDPQYEMHELTTVEPSADGWSVGFDSMGLFVPNAECKTAPSVGELIRVYGRGFGYTVRGIVIEGRVYRYESEADHEVSQAAFRERLKREREDDDEKFRASAVALQSLPAFACSDADGWAKCVATNSTDPYSYECCRYAAAWANEMEKRGPVPVADIAQDCSRVADTSGITGFMYGAAVSMLSKFWVRGEELRRWHNRDAQVGNEGDRANENGGVLNPALLSVGGGS